MNSKKTIAFAVFIAVFQLIYAQNLKPIVIQNGITIEQIQENGLDDRATNYAPYPIIFVHGLNGSYETWETIQSDLSGKGYSFGGFLDYCLNYDGTSSTCNIYSTTNSDIASYVGAPGHPFVNGDFYVVDFDLKQDGSPENLGLLGVLSNQSGIVKQGLALSDAISKVLQITGKEKVVLMGHSMGGLAIRMYLQNENIWQNDGKSHVAKIATMGTPHGGSNLGLATMALIFGMDQQSEAIRDLRTSYYYSNNQGVLLYGGKENLEYMDEFTLPFTYFYNADVNCNGFVDEYLLGLNQFPEPKNINISFSIAEGSADLVVKDENENLSIFWPNTPMEGFSTPASYTKHLNMPDELDQCYMLLDEPDDYALSYSILKNNTYKGNFTLQGSGAPYPTVDYDDFRFTVTNSGSYSFEAWTLPLANVDLNIVNSSEVILKTANSTSNNYVQTQMYLTPGTYFFELAGVPSYSSYIQPYNFSITSLSDAIEPSNIVDANISPNPTIDDKTFISCQFVNAEQGNINIFDITGRNIFSTKFEKTTDLKQEIDLSGFAEGTYLVNLQYESGVKTFKIIKN